VDGIDASTWQALGLTLTVVGLAVSALVWRRRGPAAGLRGAAWSLLPAAAGLTGTLRLVWEIGESVGHWAVRLVFSPIVWLGVILAGTSVVLFVVSGAMRRRGLGAGPDASRGGWKAALSGQATPKQSRRATGRPTGGSVPAVQDEDMDDIEAILRKHGIQ